MNQITIKVEMRVGEEIHKFLTDEAYRKKLSFEGLLISYIEERMQREKNGAQRVAR
jgi:predicted HicB family RNase H-like nuclease